MASYGNRRTRPESISSDEQHTPLLRRRSHAPSRKSTRWFLHSCLLKKEKHSNKTHGSEGFFEDSSLQKILSSPARVSSTFFEQTLAVRDDPSTMRFRAAPPKTGSNAPRAFFTWFVDSPRRISRAVPAVSADRGPRLVRSPRCLPSSYRHRCGPQHRCRRRLR